MAMTIKCLKGMGLALCVANLASAYVCLQTEVGDPLIGSNKLFSMSYEKTISTHKKYLLDLLGMLPLIFILSDGDARSGSK